MSQWSRDKRNFRANRRRRSWLAASGARTIQFEIAGAGYDNVYDNRSSCCQLAYLDWWWLKLVNKRQSVKSSGNDLPGVTAYQRWYSCYENYRYRRNGIDNANWAKMIVAKRSWPVWLLAWWDRAAAAVLGDCWQDWEYAGCDSKRVSVVLPANDRDLNRFERTHYLKVYQSSFLVIQNELQKCLPIRILLDFVRRMLRLCNCNWLNSWCGSSTMKRWERGANKDWFSNQDSPS